VKLSEKTSYFIQLLAESIYMPINAQAAKADKNWASHTKTMVTNGYSNNSVYVSHGYLHIKFGGIFFLIFWIL